MATSVNVQAPPAGTIPVTHVRGTWWGREEWGDPTTVAGTTEFHTEQTTDRNNERRQTPQAGETSNNKIKGNTGINCNSIMRGITTYGGSTYSTVKRNRTNQAFNGTSNVATAAKRNRPPQWQSLNQPTTTTATASNNNSNEQPLKIEQASYRRGINVKEWINNRNRTTKSGKIRHQQRQQSQQNNKQPSNTASHHPTHPTTNVPMRNRQRNHPG